MNFIKPYWPAPPTIKAYTTTRVGGASLAPFASFNLANHVGDDPQRIAQNRILLNEMLQLPTEPVWLNQVHGTTVIQADTASTLLTADASYTHEPNIICAVLTADCLPILICDRNATTVAAIHAGWRGLAAGVIEHTIATLDIKQNELTAWLGPAIGPQVYEVGEEVRQQFIDYHPAAEIAFQPNANERWLANIYLLAKQRLTQCGIMAIYGGDYCTYTNETLFFSYRRDGQTGRMASLIWRALL